MQKINQKLLKFSAYLALLGYLSVTITYSVHYHNIDIGSKSSSVAEEHSSNNHLVINGSEIFCTVHFAYSLLNSFTINLNTPFLELENNPEFLRNLLISSKPSKECIDYYNLRAPPTLFFS